MSELKQYEVTTDSGYTTTFQFSDEDAKERGLLGKDVAAVTARRAKAQAAAEAKAAAEAEAAAKAEADAKAAEDAKAAQSEKQAPAPQNKQAKPATSK